MKILARGVALTPELREHVERRIRFALGRTVPNMSAVTIKLADVNGPRGGIDKRCSVRVRLDGADVFVEDDASEIVVAIDRASDRAGRAVARELDRRRALGDRLSAAGPQ